MGEHNLGYSETARKYLCEKGKESCYIPRLKLWERIFLEEWEAGLYIERRGRTTKMDNPKKGMPRKIKQTSWTRLNYWKSTTKRKSRTT